MLPIVTYTEAKSRGRRDYFTGKPCKRGHVSLRTVSSGMCKQCASEANKLWMAANVDDEYKEKLREYRKMNRGRISVVAKAYRDANREKVREGERRRAPRHKEKVLTRAIQWQKDNPDKVRAREARRRSAKTKAGGRYTAEDVTALMAAQAGVCVYCPTDIRLKYQVDHKTPICRGGTSWPDNIQLLCGFCNTSKGPKTHEEYLAYRMARAA